MFALPGFWCGLVEGSELECIGCPDDYCWEEEPVRLWNETCKGERAGVLCGECREGYSEVFGTEDCIPDAECDAGGWFLPVVFGVGILYVLLVVWFPVNHHPLWKSIVYFMQIMELLTISQNYRLRSLLAVFSLDPSLIGIHVNVCPWRGLTAVHKILTDYLLPVVLLLEIALLLAGHLLVQRFLVPWFARCKERYHRSLEDDQESSTEESPFIQEQEIMEEEPNTNDEDEDEGGELSHGSPSDSSVQETTGGASGQQPINFSRYTAALTGLILLMYEGVSTATMDLLHCVSYGGELVLFRAGYESCYATWQIPVFVGLLAFLVPFPLLLIGARRILREKLHRFSAAHAVLHVLEGPYREGRKWWESVGMLRRLVLITIGSFVVNPIWRAVGLFLGCFLVLASHVLLAPMAERQHGLVETAFLCDLTILSALNLPAATIQYKGLVFIDITAEALWIVQLVLSLLPLAFCLIVVAYSILTSLFRPPPPDDSSGDDKADALPRNELVSTVRAIHSDGEIEEDLAIN